jgi:DNA ligase-1
MPVGFVAYDCLEFEGQDIRDQGLKERRKYLKQALGPLLSSQVRISEILDVKDLDDLEKWRSQSREHDAEGLMVKRWDAPYSVGRKTGTWWKHKVNPLTLDAVLLYAQAGTGRRANLYTDYTFALWKDKELVPFAKAYSGLDQKEIDELDNWIRRHTKEKFGPVRSLEPYHVFEIGFEGIGPSKRHKSGIAVRFPRILRWRKDKKVADADTLETAFELLEAPQPEAPTGANQ